MALGRSAVILLLACLAAVSADEPWSKQELLEPSVLAAAMKKGKKPVIISVAFPVLYRQRHILGALDAGAASKPEGIEALKKLVANTPKDAEVVIYCGCCPMDKCPNVRPAFAALKQMGYTKVRVLHLPTSASADWYSKDYPSEKGTPSAGGN
jgi:hypothetical protein